MEFPVANKKLTEERVVPLHPDQDMSGAVDYPGASSASI